MLDVLSTVIAITVYLFEGYMVQYMFNVFATPKYKNKFFSKYAVGLYWIGIRFLGWGIFSDDDSIFLVKKLLMFIVLLAVFSLAFYKGSIYIRLFPVIQFISIHELTFFIAYSLLYFNGPIIDLFTKWLENNWFSGNTFITCVYVTVALSTLLEAAIQILLLYFVIKTIASSYHKQEKFGKEVFYYLLPEVAGVLVAILIRLLLFMVLDGNKLILYNTYPILYLVIPSIAAVLLSAIIYGFKLYKKMALLQMERAEKVILENQIMQMQRQFNEMKQLYDGVRFIKHDMKNHMAVLKSLLDKKCISDTDTDNEIIKYFNEMDSVVEKLDNRVHTGNAVSDSIIGSKFGYAGSKIENIRLSCDDFIVSKNSRIKAYDIGIILNNGLDNAIEASVKMREKYPDMELYICVRSFRRGKMYFIEIENSFDGIVITDKESGYPQTTKEDKEVHGIGLKNIRSCARKYSGDMDCIIENDKFILSVMLKENEA